MADSENEKRVAAAAAADLVRPGQRVGLGTGTTVAPLLPALARRRLAGIVCVVTSLATEEQARVLGLPVEPFDALERLDIAIDGADQIAPDGWIIKGAGGAHTRERIVAAAAERFVVIASADKVVERLTGPVPLELMRFGLAATLRSLGDVTLRGVPDSLDGGVIADWHGEIPDPAALAARFDATPGVVDHGLFEPALISEVIIARGEDVEVRTIGRAD